MTDAQEQHRDCESLWVTDAEIARRFGFHPKTLAPILTALDKGNFGFPPRNKLFADRRYWPLVKAFCERYGALKAG